MILEYFWFGFFSLLTVLIPYICVPKDERFPPSLFMVSIGAAIYCAWDPITVPLFYLVAGWLPQHGEQINQFTAGVIVALSWLTYFIVLLALIGHLHKTLISLLKARRRSGTDAADTELKEHQ